MRAIGRFKIYQLSPSKKYDRTQSLIPQPCKTEKSENRLGYDLKPNQATSLYEVEDNPRNTFRPPELPSSQSFTQ